MHLSEIFGLSYGIYRRLFNSMPAHDLKYLIYAGKKNILTVIEIHEHRIAFQAKIIQKASDALDLLASFRKPDELSVLAKEFLDLEINLGEIDTDQLARFNSSPETTSFNSCFLCRHAKGDKTVRICEFIELSMFKSNLRVDSKCLVRQMQPLIFDQLKADIAMNLQSMKKLFQSLLDIKAFLCSLVPFADDKPLIPSYRQDDHFKPGDQVVFSYQSAIAPNLPFWAIGYVDSVQNMNPAGSSMVCRIKLDKYLNFASSYKTGDFFDFPMHVPDLMHFWEYLYLTANSDFMRMFWLPKHITPQNKFAELLRAAA